LTLLVLITEVRVRILLTTIEGHQMTKKMSKRGLTNRGQSGNLAISFSAAIATTMTTIKRKNTEYNKLV
jgi:hypothetical protein